MHYRSEAFISTQETGIMVDQAAIGSQLKTDRFPFQSEGDVALAVRNANYTLDPVMLHITMKPGAVIPAHLHKGMAETLYVIESGFTNKGRPNRHFVAFQGRHGTRPAHHYAWVQATCPLDGTHRE
jgi:hypothetical protein